MELPKRPLETGVLNTVVKWFPPPGNIHEGFRASCGFPDPQAMVAFEAIIIRLSPEREKDVVVQNLTFSDPSMRMRFSN